MQATPQSIGGGSKYSASTRVGNWQEELALDEAKKNNFLQKSASGNLFLRKQEAKIGICSEVVPHSFSEDGLIRFGDSIILQHDLTSTILAVDTFDEILQGSQKYRVSNLNIKGNRIARARNTFKIVRPPQNLGNYEDDITDPVLKIGQPFCLACNESLLFSGASSKVLSPSLYLCSTKRNERNATKISNRQLVYFAPTNDADSIWILVKPSMGRKNASDRFLAMGQPVSVSDGIQITHRQTNMYLTCDPKENYQTEFGIECETYADRSAAVGKLAIMVSEFNGTSTPQTLSKPDAPVFSWHLIYSEDENTAVDNRILPPIASMDTILSEIREYLKFRGIDGYLQLRDYFHQLESRVQTDGKFDKEDLKDALINFGLPIEAKYLNPIIELADKKRLGLIDWRELIRILRGALAPQRRMRIEDAFSRLDVRGDGVVPFSVIVNNFNASKHPLVTDCGYNEEEALTQLLGCFKGRGGKELRAATLEAFVDYYADISSNYNNDYEFEELLISNWSNLY